MKVFFYPYKLNPQSALNVLSKKEARQGYLLRVEWSEGLVGFADLHPWVELGDYPLEKQRSLFLEGQSTPLLIQSLWHARRDAEARAQSKSLFEGFESIKNNYLITDLKNLTAHQIEKIRNNNFDTLKIKVGRDPSAELVTLNHLADYGFKIRLDFNAAISVSEFYAYMGQMKSKIFEFIEYVEDPFPFDQKHWSQARKITPIALDHQESFVNWVQLEEKAFDVLAIKPAKTTISSAIAHCLKFDLKATVTSYMDHPVGLSHALSVGMKLKKSYGDRILQAGCMTHHLYEPDDFSAELRINDSSIIPPQGSGVGFNQLLEALPWQHIGTPSL